MTDNRICSICDLTLNTIEHMIFGGSPTFHGFVDSGRRVATLPGQDSPDAIVPPAAKDWREGMTDADVVHAVGDCDCVTM